MQNTYPTPYCSFVQYGAPAPLRNGNIEKRHYFFAAPSECLKSLFIEITVK
jgi:hypothetical protein